MKPEKVVGELLTEGVSHPRLFSDVNKSAPVVRGEDHPHKRGVYIECPNGYFQSARSDTWYFYREEGDE